MYSTAISGGGCRKNVSFCVFSSPLGPLCRSLRFLAASRALSGYADWAFRPTGRHSGKKVLLPLGERGGADHRPGPGRRAGLLRQQGHDQDVLRGRRRLGPRSQAPREAPRQEGLTGAPPAAPGRHFALCLPGLVDEPGVGFRSPRPRSGQSMSISCCSGGSCKPFWLVG